MSRCQTSPDRDCGRESTEALLISRSVVESVELAWDEPRQVFIKDDVETAERRRCRVLQKFVVQTFRAEVPQDFIVGDRVLTSGVSSEGNPLKFDLTGGSSWTAYHGIARSRWLGLYRSSRSVLSVCTPTHGVEGAHLRIHDIVDGQGEVASES